MCFASRLPTHLHWTPIAPFYRWSDRDFTISVYSVNTQSVSHIICDTRVYMRVCFLAHKFTIVVSDDNIVCITLYNSENSVHTA